MIIEQHENSYIHCNAVESYLRASNNMSVEYLTNRNLVTKKKRQIIIFTR